MKIVEQIKFQINNRKQFNNNSQNRNQMLLEYKCVLDKIKQYEELYKDEVDNLKGHTHFAKKELTELVSNFMTENPEIVSYQDMIGKSIAMYCADIGLEEIVLQALDDETAAIQQDYLGYNLGMLAARNKLETATIKALDNQVASIQQNESGENIGMVAARNDLINATMKAVENKEAIHQVNMLGCTIGLTALHHKMEEPVIKQLDMYPETLGQKSGYNVGYKTIAETFGLTNVIQKVYEVSRVNKSSCQDDTNENEL